METKNILPLFIVIFIGGCATVKTTSLSDIEYKDDGKTYGKSTNTPKYMETQANLSFERMAGEETLYNTKRNPQPWVHLLDRKNWPSAWIVRERKENNLILPRKKEVAKVSKPYTIVKGSAHEGKRSLKITGGTGENCFIMGRCAFPLIPIRNYFKTQELKFDLKGWVKGENATGNIRVGLVFTQHSDAEYGLRGNYSVKCPNGNFPWTSVKLKTPKNGLGRWVRIGIYATGNTGQVWFDDFSLSINGIDIFTLMAKVQQWRDGYTQNARLQAVLPEALIWTEDPGQRVLPWSQPPPKNGKSLIDLSAAKGEYESFQLAINPLKDIKGLTVSFSDIESLSGKTFIARKNLEAREAVLVKRVEIGDFIDPPLVPDPLLRRSSYNFKRGVSRSLWITLYVPRNTPGGEYKGTVTLGGPLNLKIPLKVKVRNFSLPERTSFNMSCGIEPGNIAIYDKRPWLKVMRDYLPNLAAHRARIFNFTMFPVPVIKGGQLSLDQAGLKKSDATIDYALSLGFHTFTTSQSPFYVNNNRIKIWKSFPGVTQSQKFNTGLVKFDASFHNANQEFKRFYGKYLELTAAHYRKKRTLKHIVQYIFDETFIYANTEKQRRTVEEIYALTKKAGFRTLLTSDPELKNKNIDIWCPMFYRCIGDDLPIVRKVQHKGQKVWWYHNGLYTFNRSVINARLAPLMTWRYQLDGFLIWSLTYWCEGDPWTRARLDGDGYLLYPNPNGSGAPCSSIRWELFREGIEDFDYFVILKNRAQSVLADKNATIEKRKQAKLSLLLLKKIETLIPHDSDMLTQEQDPVKYSELRKQVARAIEKLGGDGLER